MEIPLPQSMQNEDSIFNYGFNKSLNRNTVEIQTPEVNMTEKVRDALLQVGIDINSVNNKSSGSFERNDFHWYTLFESLDGYETARVTIGPSYITMATDGSNGDVGYILKQLSYGVTSMSWDKKRTIATKIRFEDNTNQTMYIVTGQTTSTGEHFGFKVVDNIIYGSVADGTTESLLTIGTISGPPDEILLVAKFFPKEKVEFFIDNASVGVISTTIPSASTFAWKTINIRMTADEAAVKTLKLSYWDFWQSN